MAHRGLILLLLLGALTVAGGAAGADDWRAEFNDVCAKTTEAMNLPREELLLLIAKCERVEKALESQDETVRKLYLKRVQMCLGLFRYVADTTASGRNTPPPAK